MDERVTGREPLGVGRMKRILKLHVRQLEYLFSPPGMPVVAKVPEAAESTSILVRGKAGTGKTTLATTLALAIAEFGEGRAAYLGTEIAPADVFWKLEKLGLKKEEVAAWDRAQPQHRVLVQHLSAATERDVTQPERRMQVALEILWEMVTNPPAGLPLRAVVVDAFSLVGAKPDQSMRGDLLALIQASEARGVSVILVEEASSTGSEWGAYLVDVVFELVWGEDPDTGGMLRKLACSKVRYSRSRAGPHDYGMEGESVAVWPALTSLQHELWGEENRPVVEPLLVPWSGGIAIARGGLFASVYDSKNGNFLRVLRNSPWFDTPRISCGTVSRGQGDTFVDAIEGPEALIWMAVPTVEENTSVVFQDVEALLGRKRFRHPLMDGLAALAQAGFRIIVHGPDHAVREMPAAFRIIFGRESVGQYFSFNLPRYAMCTALATITNSVEIAGPWFTSSLSRKSAITSLFAALSGENNSVRKETLMWASAHATYLSSDSALEWLEAQRAQTALLRLPALAIRGRLEEADALATNLSSPVIEDVMRKRLRGASRLDHPDKSVFLEGAAILSPLVESSGVLDNDRANIALDLACAAKRWKDLDQARFYRDRAKTLLLSLEPEPELADLV